MPNNLALSELNRGGRLDGALSSLYGESGLSKALSRCEEVIFGFFKAFGYMPAALFSAPGRTELGGNHTDHQRGHVLAAAVDLDILAAVRPASNGIIRVSSSGFPFIKVDLNELEPKGGELGTSSALVRGIAARFASLGCKLSGTGFDAHIISDIPGGSGLSSSAAFEVLIATIINSFFMESRLDPVDIAQIGQYAENVYFGKPCGLMDQAASAVGGVAAIDLAENPRRLVRRLSLDLKSFGYALCILDSGAGHANLTGEYAAITGELKAICSHFGKEVLREVPEDAFMEAIPKLRREAGDRAVLRGLHFYSEDRRAVRQAQALESGDFDTFLELVRDSGVSSAMCLQNIIPSGGVRNQELMLTIKLCEHILGGRGAVRVHGGGFGGTAQAFVPLDMLDPFKERIEAVIGKGGCHVLSIRPAGGIRII